MNSTLRTRLLLGISATIIVTLCSTHCGMYALMRRQLFAEFDQALAAKARALAVLVEQDGDRINLEFQQHPMQEFARGVRPEYYQVWHEDGTILARSRRLQDDNLLLLQGDRVVPQIRDCSLPDGRHGRVAGIRFRPNMEGDLPESPKPVVRDASGRIEDLPDDDDDALDLDDINFAARPFVTLVVARDTQDLNSSLAGLTWLLTGSGLLATVVILGVLAWLVTRNLRPLQSLAKQIGGVNEQTLNQRFALQNAPGELHPIVTRLNGLMSCLETAFLREKTFTADVAHELRTPLAGIRSTLEVSLSRQRDGDSYRSSMEKCLSISEDTETIVGTLLSLSRIEAGHARLETDVVDLAHLIQRAWRPFASRATESNVSVSWSLDTCLVLKTDPGKLQVVITNLLDNATSYVNCGGTISVSTFVDNQSIPRLVVANSGCDLTPDQVEHAYDRFWRADVARAATGIHSGLGLALSRRIIQFLEGQIEIQVHSGSFIAEIQLPASCVEYANDAIGVQDHSFSFEGKSAPPFVSAESSVLSLTADG